MTPTFKDSSPTGLSVSPKRTSSKWWSGWKTYSTTEFLGPESSDATVIPWEFQWTFMDGYGHPAMGALKKGPCFSSSTAASGLMTLPGQSKEWPWHIWDQYRKCTEHDEKNEYFQYQICGGKEWFDQQNRCVLASLIKHDQTIRTYFLSVNGHEWPKVCPRSTLFFFISVSWWNLMPVNQSHAWQPKRKKVPCWCLAASYARSMCFDIPGDAS